MNRGHYQTIIEPHFTEKAARISEASNQLVFRIARDATRHQVKRAVEVIFEVDVDAVRVLNVRGKQGRNRLARQCYHPGWKKAYVRLAPGFEIDFSRF